MSQMLFALGSKSFVVLNWKINQDYITEKYCENKDKPMMNCNGKCYLSKQLEKLELKEKEEREKYPSPKSQVETTNFAWTVENLLIEINTGFKLTENKLGLHKPIFWYNTDKEVIYHPPIV
jgi:hypothetical protein